MVAGGPTHQHPTRHDPTRHDRPSFFERTRFADYVIDPYPTLAALRESGRVHQTPEGVWLLTRYEDVSGFLRHPSASNNLRGTGAPAPVRGGALPGYRDGPVPVASLDGPQHARVRQLLGRAFSPRLVERLTARVDAVAADLLDRIEAGGGTGDLVADLAFPLPMTIIGDLLGVPAADRNRIREWGRVLAANGDPEFLLGADQRAEAAAAEQDFGGYFARLALRRRRRPGDDLISALATAADGEDALSFAELVVNGIFLFVNGYHNTVSLIANGAVALLRQPDQLALLRADPSLAGRAVEETLRFDSPIQSIARVTLTDQHFGDELLPAGAPVMSLLGAAHRDPRSFSEPDRFDLTRPAPARALSFGAGPHYCLGAALDRREAAAALSGLAVRFSDLELTGEPEWQPTVALRGPVRVSVAYRHSP